MGNARRTSGCAPRLFARGGLTRRETAEVSTEHPHRSCVKDSYFVSSLCYPLILLTTTESIVRGAQAGLTALGVPGFCGESRTWRAGRLVAASRPWCRSVPGMLSACQCGGRAQCCSSLEQRRCHLLNPFVHRCGCPRRFSLRVEILVGVVDRLAVFRDHVRDDLNHLACLLVDDLGGAVVDLFHRRRIGARMSQHRLVLPVEHRRVGPLRLAPFAVLRFDGDLHVALAERLVGPEVCCRPRRPWFSLSLSPARGLFLLRCLCRH